MKAWSLHHAPLLREMTLQHNPFSFILRAQFANPKPAGGPIAQFYSRLQGIKPFKRPNQMPKSTLPASLTSKMPRDFRKK